MQAICLKTFWLKLLPALILKPPHDDSPSVAGASPSCEDSADSAFIQKHAVLYSMILNTSRHLQLYCPKCAIRLRHLRPKLSFQIARWTWPSLPACICSTHRRHVGHALLRNLLDFSTLRTTQNLKTSKRWAQVVWTLICSVRGAAWVWSAASLETS